MRYSSVISVVAERVRRAGPSLKKSGGRGDRVAWAVATSILSKGANLLLQLVALPFVARILGAASFGAYSVLSGVPSWLTAAELGVGPALAHKIAETEAINEKRIQSRYFVAALLVATVTGLIIITSSIVFVQCGGPILVFGSRFAAHIAELNRGLYIIAAAVALQLVASVGAKARAGFQEVHVNNAFGAAGNLAIATMLVVLLTIWPSVATALVAVYLTGVLIQATNILALLSARPYLVSESIFLSIRYVPGLLGDGVLYAIAVGLIGLQREFARVMVARSGGPFESAKFGIANSVLTMVMGITIMLTSALWPALADARARSDRDWLNKAKRLMFGGAWLYGAVVVLLIGLGGSRFTSILYGPNYGMSGATWWLLASYACAIVVGHVRFTWLLGFRHSRKLAAIAAGECASNAICLTLLRSTTLAAAMAILAVNHFFFSVVLQGIMIRRSSSALVQ